MTYLSLFTMIQGHFDLDVLVDEGKGFTIMT